MASANPFTETLRQWRKATRMSQLELALAANVSQRHVSWLETGRSQPSREMVLRLTEAMDIPLRQRNQLLNAAGFASLYREQDLDAPAMTTVRSVLTTMLTHQEPFPAFVLDRYWNIHLQNEAAGRLLGLVGDIDDFWRAVGDSGERNLALLSVHPDGLRPFISNWDDIAPPFMQRLRREAIESGDPDVMLRFEQLRQYVPLDEPDIGEELTPVLPLEISVGPLQLGFTSVISTFGTAQDITANELRVETFYPANETSAAFLRQAAGAAGG